MPVLLLVIHIQSVCRKAILICLIPIVAGVSNCGRCYHIYGGITFFEGSAPKNEVKRRPYFFLKILYCTPLPRVCFIVALHFHFVASQMVSWITIYSHPYGVSFWHTLFLSVDY